MDTGSSDAPDSAVLVFFVENNNIASMPAR